MEITSEELQLLAQVGLIATRRHDSAAVTAIFSCIEQARPTSPIAFIGPALGHLWQGRGSEAIACLERGLARVEEGDRCVMQAFIAMACHAYGRSAQCDRALGLAGEEPIAVALRRFWSGSGTT